MIVQSMDYSDYFRACLSRDLCLYKTDIAKICNKILHEIFLSFIKDTIMSSRSLLGSYILQWTSGNGAHMLRTIIEKRVKDKWDRQREHIDYCTIDNATVIHVLSQTSSAVPVCPGSIERF